MTAAQASAPHFAGQPRAMMYLALAEFWERFSLLGMRAILVFYLIRRFGFSNPNAIVLYGGFAALCVLMILIGGIIADRLTGTVKAVLFGGLMMIFGSIALLLSSLPAGLALTAPAQSHMLYFGLTFMAVGSGLLKCATTSMLGRSYPPDDPRRAAGFTVYYAGTNFGPGIAALICGYVGETCGFSWTFGIAATGMALGLVTFLAGRDHYERAVSLDPRHGAELVGRAGVGLAIVVGLALLLGVALQYGLLFRASLTSVGLVVLLYVIAVMMPRLDGEDRKRMFACLAVLAAGQWFWIVYVLTGGAVNLFVDTVVNRTLWGITIPASTYQSLEPLLSILCGPIVVWTTSRLRRRRDVPFTAVVAVGIALAGTATIYLGAVGLLASGRAGDVSGQAAIVYFVLLAFADMIVAPAVLSTFSRIAPNRLLGLINGLWYLCSAFAHLIAASAAALALDHGAARGWPVSQSLGLFFVLLGTACAVGGALLAVGSKTVRQNAGVNIV